MLKYKYKLEEFFKKMVSNMKKEYYPVLTRCEIIDTVKHCLWGYKLSQFIDVQL